MIGKRAPTINLTSTGHKSDSSRTNPLTGNPYSERYYTLLAQRKKLPAWEAKDHLLELMKTHQIVVLQGETGSGKTTQIPQFLIEGGYASK